MENSEGKLIDKLELKPTLPTWLWVYKNSEGKGTPYMYTLKEKSRVPITPDLRGPTHPVRIILEERGATMKEWKDRFVGSFVKWNGAG